MKTVRLEMKPERIGRIYKGSRAKERTLGEGWED